MPHVKRAVPTVALLMMALAFSACSSGAPQPPDEPPGITGQITSIGGSPDRLTMLVEGEGQEPGAVSDKASVTVTKETVVVGLDGERMDPSALQAGMAVRVWFEGPVAESYPVQGTAGFVQQMP